ncbi:hypothetical protein [Geoalkalibacter halelectricus]|uniref:Uncharacterized protein n=1 Tax=Geoalkalibacter halelectricus TaxID=2847045 RepID=A0ABY5ZFX2_9BACT|nr:hypothetical protein [Geoalkalibacter halelectricus]MDO3378112.1 hypothetical protein [Geoalkalibacter halelectricus]UWZ77958.1 hypothetical protein L9S41_09605 [Geoalkalibacter halelectricus]
MTISWTRLVFFGFSVLAGVLGAILGQPLIHGNDMAINVIVTVFSILAGFLVAIMTMMGDPSAFYGRSWRANEKGREKIFNQLVRQKWMFILYLVTLGLVLAASLVGKVLPELAIWMERVYLGTAITAFMLSLGLPSTLMKIQLAKHDEITKSKMPR